MNKFVIGALALTSAGPLAYAGGAETRDWSTLDRDMLSLTTNQGAAAGSWGIHGFVRERFARSKDVDVDPGTTGGQDLSGFNLDNARLEFDASQGDYGAFISVNATGGQSSLLDAFGTFKIAEGFTGQVGRFKAPFLWSAFMVNDNNQILLDRTFNGQNWQGRDDGLEIAGTFDKLSWWGAVQNGADGVQDRYMWTGRVQFNILGTGLGKQEGACGNTGNDTNLMVGVAYSEDDGVSRAINAAGGGPDNVNAGGAWAIDGGLVQQGFSLHVEIVDYQHDIQPESNLNTSTGVINSAGASTALTGGNSKTPWSATAGYLLNNNVEFGARYEDLDDDDNTTVWTLGLNYYISNHNAKWTLQGSRSNSDVNAKEADTIAIGLCVGA